MSVIEVADAMLGGCEEAYNMCRARCCENLSIILFMLLFSMCIKVLTVSCRKFPCSHSLAARKIHQKCQTVG
jgi:hypothetical protein